jgi:hypothetical protein
MPSIVVLSVEFFIVLLNDIIIIVMLSVVASFSQQEGQNWGNYPLELDIQAETCDIFLFFNHIGKK